MNDFQLPSDAYYTPEGAIVFRKPQREKDIEQVEDKLSKLEQEIEILKSMLRDKDNAGN